MRGTAVGFKCFSVKLALEIIVGTPNDATHAMRKTNSLR